MLLNKIICLFNSKHYSWPILAIVLFLPLFIDTAFAQTATRLNCGGCVSSRNLNSGVVTTSKLGDKAVTGAKIANGTIGNGKIRSRSLRAGSLATNSVNNRVLAPDAVFLRTIIVRPDGTNAENCTALLAALSSITDNSAATPYLVIAEPGRYSCGNRTVRTKRFVDLQGSGEGITRISGARNSNTQGVVELVGPSELRQITVEHDGSNNLNSPIAVSTVGAGTSLRAVTAISGSALSGGSTAVLANRDSEISVRDSTVNSQNSAFFADQRASIRVVNTQITTPDSRDNTIGDVACLNAYTEDLVLLNSVCQ